MILFLSLLITWIINMACLIAYMVLQEASTYSIIAIVGVALTGILPGLFRHLCGKKGEPNGFSIRRALHVVAGVVGIIGTGLLLGEAIKESQEYLWLAATGAVVHVISGVTAHLYFVKVSADDSLAYELFDRYQWYIIIAATSLCALVYALLEEVEIASPIIHLSAFLVLLFADRTNLLVDIINYTVLHTAGVVSTMGLILSDGAISDVVLTFVVYLYLAMVHL
jgi:hypothetical protein